MVPGFDPFQAAKKAAEQAALAAQAAREATEKAVSAASGLGEKSAAKAEEATAFLAGARDQAAAKVASAKDLIADKMVEAKEAALTGIREVVDDLNEHLPALQEAGYTLSGVAIELGLAPHVVATFSTRPDISRERVEAVMAQHAEAKVTVALLRALYSAYKLQSTVHIAGMKPVGIAVTIGLPPSIVVHFA